MALLPTLSDAIGRELQGFLNARGFEAGRIDGVVGRRTTRALQEYLRETVDSAIQVDGVWGPQTAGIFEQSVGRILGERGAEPSVRIRLVIHTSSRKRSDYYTFEHEAMRLASDYQRHYRGDQVRRLLVHNGREIVQAINSCPRGSIVSLDIVSHANFGGIHISNDLAQAKRADPRRQQAHLAYRSHGRNPQTAKDAMFMEEELRGLYTDHTVACRVGDYFNQHVADGTAYLDAVAFDRFAYECYVELHGCRTADRSMPLDFNDDAFITRLSDQLPRDAIVVGHTTGSYPKGSDGYRHGEVSVMRCGREVLTGARERMGFPNASTPGNTVDLRHGADDHYGEPVDRTPPRCGDLGTDEKPSWQAMNPTPCDDRYRQPPSDRVPPGPRDRVPPPRYDMTPPRRDRVPPPRRDTPPPRYDTTPPRRDQVPPPRRDEVPPRRDDTPGRPERDIPWGAILGGAVAIGSAIHQARRDRKDRRDDRRDDHRRDDHRRDDYRQEPRRQDRTPPRGAGGRQDRTPPGGYHREDRSGRPAGALPSVLGGFGGFGAFGRNR